LHFDLAALALALEAGVGYPDALFRRIGHPVVWLGTLIAALDARLNNSRDDFERRRRMGVVAIGIVVLAAALVGAATTELCSLVIGGPVLLALLSSSLLAQRSLHEHVRAVADALAVSLEDGRRAVAQIVGRDVSALDEAGVARAAIESLAENFSDGVVAPALFLAVFGLPGALVYKAVNTADSMIGHKSPRHLAFGWAAARLDDLLNLLPARFAAGLIALAAWLLPSASATDAFRVAQRDAARHASPNAGWPEAAMAGALGLCLGGPRAYGTVDVAGATLGDGRREATVADIRHALALYWRASAGLWLTFIAVAAASF
jgi:adenosylcobinamide-phosphate synthase